MRRFEGKVALVTGADCVGPVLQALNDAVRATLGHPAVSEKLLASGAVPLASSPQQLGALLKRDTEKWGRLIRAKKITAQ